MRSTAPILLTALLVVSTLASLPATFNRDMRDFNVADQGGLFFRCLLSLIYESAAGSFKNIFISILRQAWCKAWASGPPDQVGHPSLHCGLRYTKKLTGSDFISNIKKVYVRNCAQLLNCFPDLLYLKNVCIRFVYNLIEPEIQPSKTVYLWLGAGPPVKP